MNKRKKIQLNKQMKIFNENVQILIRDMKLIRLDKFIQHGTTSCFLHSIAVAHYSMKLFNFLKINYDAESLAKGALLHDYFLYDWHEDDKSHSLHGFRHPKTALKNAMRDFVISDISQNIIKRHMFPLIPFPPKYREGVVACLVDKICSVYETFKKKDQYKTVRKIYFQNEKVL